MVTDNPASYHNRPPFFRNEKTMNTVNLTARQKKFFDYFIGYHQKNGVFPTMTQGSRDLRVSITSITTMYGALLLKGAFTSGQPIVAGNKPRRNATAVKPVNLSDMKFDFTRNVRKRYTKKAVMERLLKVLEKDDPNAKKIADLLGL